MYWFRLFRDSIKSKFLTHNWTSSLFSSLIYLDNFNADNAIMMKMWDIASSNRGGRGLASFIKTMNLPHSGLYNMLLRATICVQVYRTYWRPISLGKRRRYRHILSSATICALGRHIASTGINCRWRQNGQWRQNMSPQV